MKPERWEQVEKVYQEALLRKQSERAEFLLEACHGDPDMRREIDSLLEFQEKTNGFMEAPAFDVVAQMITPGPNAADETIGPEFAHYSVVEKLGSGGMGVVYKARDERLHRFVALKILPRSFTVNQERLRLFEREARSASALNHPNVVTIYEVGHVNSTPYIAMEFVEGSTLKQLLARGPMPIATVFLLADQLAGGLAKIHASGLIHGDLKPENIMITDDGLAKILDFGLARLVLTVDVPSHSKTADTTSTGLAGTVSYMSPEQILGRPRDFRSDQFSYGCILYEMVTGHGAFRRETMAQTREAIISGELNPIGDSRPVVPKPFCAIVERCLEMEPAKRYESTMDLVRALRNFRDAQIAPRDHGPSRSRRLVLVVASLMVVVTATGASSRPLRQWFFGIVGVQSSNIESLAVLPLVSQSRDERGEKSADVMTELLISELGKINDLVVPSHITMLSYKNSKRTAQEIARELKVDVVLESSLLQTNQNVQITAKLVSATTGRSSWQHEYRRPLEEILTLQREVAKDVALQVNRKLTPKQESRVSRREKVKPEAFWTYTLGLNEFNKRSPEGLKKSSDDFTEATHQDLYFAEAYAALSNSYIAQGFNGMLLPWEAHQAARDAALVSLSLDDEIAEAHAALGRIRTVYEWDWSAAESQFLKAEELNKNSALVYQWYSTLLVATNRMDEAIAMNQRALIQDPLSPISHTNQGWILYLAGKYPEAIKEYRRALELDSNFTMALTGLADAYEKVDRFDDAFYTRQKWLMAGGITPHDLAELERAYRAGGTAEYWKMRLKMESEEEQNSGDQWTYLMALLNAKVGNREQALDWLERAFEEHHDHLIYLKVEPAFDALRSDPKFADLVRRVGLP